MNDKLKHWLKIDHITFLLIAPAILFDNKTTALFFWSMALLYDIYEQVKKTKNK